MLKKTINEFNLGELSKFVIIAACESNTNGTVKISSLFNFIQFINIRFIPNMNV